MERCDLQTTFLSWVWLGLGIIITSWPLESKADFLIEFTDGSHVLAPRYVEEGSSIKVYTENGAVGFRKPDIKRISTVKTDQTADEALGTVHHLATRSFTESTNIKGGGQGTGQSPGQNEKSKAGNERETPEQEIVRIDSQYHDVSQKFTSLWEKHQSDLQSGASEEALAQNRRQLEELSNERFKLVKDARRAHSEELPDWAQ